MFSKKEVFENYLGKLGLNKTAFEAVKDINGVLFEGLDDLLGDLENEVNQEDGDEEVAPVPEITPPTEKKNEYDPIELEGKLKVPFGEAINLAMMWAKNNLDLASSGITMVDLKVRRICCHRSQGNKSFIVKIEFRTWYTRNVTSLCQRLNMKRLPTMSR